VQLSPRRQAFSGSPCLSFPRNSALPRRAGNGAGSVRLEARERHHLAPLLGFGGDERTELGGRARKRGAASLVSIDDLGVATAFLAQDAARRLITGETLYIDDGYHIID
jgi:enoyl-[acyl-carrier protein] reductase I